MNPRVVRWGRLLALAGGLALLAAVLARVPLAHIWTAAVGLGPAVLLTPLLGVAWLAANTTGMYWLCDRGVPWLRLYFNRLVGDGYNNLLPLGIAGEVVKVQHLGAIIGTERALTAVVRDRFVENIVGRVWAVVAIAAALASLDFGPALTMAFLIYAAAALGIAGCEAAFVLSRLPGRLAGRVARWLGHPEELVREPLPAGTFVITAGWTFVGRLLGLLEILLLFRLFGMKAGISEAFIMHGILAAAGDVGFFIPAGIGVTEAASLVVFDALGAPAGAAVAFALVRRARLVLVSLFGVSLHLGRKASLRWLRGLAVVAVIAGCAWFVRGLNVDLLWRTLRAAAIWPIAVAAVLSFGIMYWKAVCWHVMLQPVAQVPVLRIYRYTLASFAASTIAPARAGEVLRVWLLKRRDGVPMTTGTAVALAEKLVDGLAMLLLVAPLPWLLPGLPAWVGRSIAVLFAGGMAALVVIWVVMHRAHPEKWLGRFIAGMDVLRRPRGFVLSLLACVAAWICDLSAVWLVLYAVGVQIPVAGGLLVLLTVNMAILVPSTPAHVGALEIGALAALDLLGVPRAQGLAFGLLYHAMQVVPLMVVGLADMRFVLAARREAQKTEPAL